MKQFIVKHKRSITGISACLLIAVVTLSFQNSPFIHAMLDKSAPLQDTVPVKKQQNSMTMKEFDRLSENLDKEIANQLKQIDLQKIKQDVAISLKEIDFDKIMKEVELSLKDIDTEKILADVKKEIATVKYDDISAETKLALANAQKELEKAQEEIKNINKEEIRKELENARLQLEKNKDEFRKIDLSRIMKQAQKGIDKAKLELKQLKEMFTEMEKDGLINQQKGFTINYKDKDLYINGSKQPEQVTDKYRKYFKEDHFEITIDKE